MHTINYLLKKMLALITRHFVKLTEVTERDKGPSREETSGDSQSVEQLRKKTDCKLIYCVVLTALKKIYQNLDNERVQEQISTQDKTCCQESIVLITTVRCSKIKSTKTNC